jgi:hypothetical protein
MWKISRFDLIACPDCLLTAGQIGLVNNISVPLGRYIRGEAYLAAGHGRARCQVLEDSRSQRHGMELLNGGVGDP